MGRACSTHQMAIDKNHKGLSGAGWKGPEVSVKTTKEEYTRLVVKLVHLVQK